MSEKDTQSRKWLLTINNPSEHDLTHDFIKLCLADDKRIEYWCMCDETGGKENTYHTHLYIYSHSPIRFSKIKKMFPIAHIDKAQGTSAQNRDYVGKLAPEHHRQPDGSYSYQKDGKLHEGINHGDTFEEFGECPVEQPGKRTDLNVLYNLIKDGSSNFEILEHNPAYMNRLETIEKVRETLRYEEFKSKRRTKLYVEYWYGDPGTGKTSGVLNQYGDANVYMVTDYKHPWDGYKGQDIVLFDDFDSRRIVTNDLLKWLDVYPLELPARFSNKIACYTKVYITSNKSPDELWDEDYRWNRKEYDALMRRIHKIIRFYKDGKSEVTYEKIQDGFMKVSEKEMEQIEMMFGK